MSTTKSSEAAEVTGGDTKWFNEKETDLWKGQRMGLRVKKCLADRKTKYQHLQVFETESYGRMLVLDGVIQLTERDEFAYQEMLAHVPVFSHPSPKSALVVGGGDGGIIRELCRHSTLERIVMVELDEGVPAASKEFFSTTMATAFGDERVELIIGDGAAFMSEEKNHGKFDIIIVDSSDPIGPASVLFENKFYSDIARVLAPGGVCATQGECMWLHATLIREARL